MADLFLSGVVGYDITGEKVKNFLATNDDEEVTVYINSPGGYVFEGLEVYNLLRASGRKIKTVLTGLAASMGSIIFLAGDDRVAMTGSLYMVHKPSGISWGNADEMRKEADLLDKIQGSLSDIYKERANIESIDEYINQETWFDTNEMSDLGIVNSSEKPKIKAIYSKETNEGEDMSKIDDLKAELEKVNAENAELKEKQEEAELEAQIAKAKAETEAMKAKAEAKAEADKKANEKADKDAKDKLEKAEAEQEAKEKAEQEAKDKAEAEKKAIDMTKAVKVEDKTNALPAFMQSKSSY